MVMEPAVYWELLISLADLYCGRACGHLESPTSSATFFPAGCGYRCVKSHVFPVYCGLLAACAMEVLSHRHISSLVRTENWRRSNNSSQLRELITGRPTKENQSKLTLHLVSPSIPHTLCIRSGLEELSAADWKETRNWLEHLPQQCGSVSPQ